MILIRNSKAISITAKLETFKEANNKQSPLSGAEMIEYKELNADGEIQSGLLVTDVTEGSQAFLAGLQKGDTIRAINRKLVKTLNDLKTLLEKEDTNFLFSVERNKQNFYLGSD